jgi:hypothetical protein
MLDCSIPSFEHWYGRSWSNCLYDGVRFGVLKRNRCSLCGVEGHNCGRIARNYYCYASSGIFKKLEAASITEGENRSRKWRGMLFDKFGIVMLGGYAKETVAVIIP